MNIRMMFFLVLISTLITGGCTALNTFPTAARSGDTIALAVGSPEDMTRSNTTATFTSDTDGVPVDLTPNIRSIFKLYADKTSKVYESSSTTSSLVGSAGHEPWITVVAVDLPTGLAVGPGEVQFNTTATYPDIGSHINDVPISLEILPGEGSPSNFEYEFGIGGQSDGDLSKLEPRPRIVLGPAYPSTACPCPDYGAIEVKVNMPTTPFALPASDYSAFMDVYVEDLTVETISTRGYTYALNGNELTVIFTSPIGKLKYYEARFSIVLRSPFEFDPATAITSVRYFNVDGDEVTGPVSDYFLAER